MAEDNLTMLRLIEHGRISFPDGFRITLFIEGKTIRMEAQDLEAATPPLPTMRYPISEAAITQEMNTLLEQFLKRQENKGKGWLPPK
jgi:hypothetical protein